MTEPLPAGFANRIVVGGVDLTWRTLPQLPLPSPAAVFVEAGFPALAAVKEHVAHGTELLLATPALADDELRVDLRAAGFALVTPATAAAIAPTGRRAPQPGRLWLLAPGPAGRPGLVGHTLPSLAPPGYEERPREAGDGGQAGAGGQPGPAGGAAGQDGAAGGGERVDAAGGPGPSRTWLCPYPPGTYEWWGLVSVALTRPGQHLVVAEPDEWESWPRIARACGVTAAAGSVAFWRQTLERDAGELAGLPLDRVTVGGGPMDREVLDGLREVFPAGRVSWADPPGEPGVSIVEAGRAGLPGD